jgi:predicted Zn-dependent protease
MSTDRLAQLLDMLAEEPGDAFLRYAIALERKRSGQNADAITDLESLLTDQPGHVPSYYQLALLLIEQRRIPEAIHTCEAGSLQALVQGDRKARTELIALRDQLIEDQE